MNAYTIIELVVNNHPGVMSHVTGLFSRRGYNLEGILCGRIGDGRRSVMFLLIDVNDRYQQVIRQLEKLHDVLELKVRADMNPEAFTALETCMHQDGLRFRTFVNRNPLQHQAKNEQLCIPKR